MYVQKKSFSSFCCFFHQEKSFFGFFHHRSTRVLPQVFFDLKIGLDALFAHTCCNQCLGLFQGCQMVYFQTINPNLGKKILGLKYENVDIFYGHWEYLTGIWDLL
jgi:hypothetical protein